jgi:serine/threonine protein kinase
MHTGRTRLEDLAPDERADVERRLVAFDAGWEPGRLAEEARRLPADARWRWAAVVEMVKVDLERRWAGGERPGLSEYVRAFPELVYDGGPPAELLRAEAEVRAEFGPDPSASSPWLTGEAGEPEATAPGPADGTHPGGPPARSRLPALAVPGTFGRYRLVRLLGRGGMGEVYLAHDPQLDRDLALKIPAPGFAAAATTEQVLREARAAAALHHPNICPVYDVGEIDGIPFITSLYVEGEPLSAVARRRPLVSEREAVRIVAAVARALAYAHSRGVIHRDLKPGNVMLDRHGTPVVTDFGLARRAAPGAAVAATMTGLVGSPAYMAPEQVAEAKAGPASDLFSLGVVLYELLTGRTPFHGTVAEVLGRLVNDTVPPPSEFRPGLDPRLEVVCLKALARRPEDRYADMAEFAAALEAIADRRPPPRRRLLVAGLALVLVGAGGWFAWDRLRPRPDIPPEPGPKPVIGGGGNGGGLVHVAPPPRRIPSGEYVPEYTRKDRGFDPFMLRKRPAFSGDERPTTVAGWHKVLESRDVDDRMIAVEELARFKNPAAIGPLARRMLLKPAEEGQPPHDAEHWSVRRECAAAVGYLGVADPVTAGDALAQRVADPWWRTRVHNGDNQWRNPVLAYYEDPLHGGKEAALDALAAVDPERVAPALRDALARKDPPNRKPPASSHRPLVRAWAAERLVEYDSPETVKALCDALTDDYPLVRKRAAETLLKLKAAAAAVVLARRVADSVWMKETHRDLLGLIADYYADPEWGGKADALAALEVVAPDRVADALTEASRSSDPGVAAWAAGEIDKRKKK